MARLSSTQSEPRGDHAPTGLLTHRSVADTLISLAGLIGRPVQNQAGDEVGKLADVVARWDGGSYPPATGLVVRVGRRVTFLPIAQVQSMDDSRVRLRSARLDLRDFERRTGEVVLGRDVIDHQLVDVDGVRVVRASDLYLAHIGLAWRLVGVDVSLQSLLRRLGPARWRNQTQPKRILDWGTVQPFGASSGTVRLSRPSQALKRLRPAEIADLLEELGRDERHELLDALGTDEAADALEEMQPEELEQLLRDAPRAKAAALVAAMEPDEAVEALRALEPGDRDEILAAMDAKTAIALSDQLEYHEASAGGLMTTHLVTATPAMTVAEIRDLLRERAGHQGELDRVVMVDNDGRFVDDISLFTLLTAFDTTQAGALTTRSSPLTVTVKARFAEVVDRLMDSRSTSVVVVDEDHHPVGRILADDIIDALAPERSKLRFPRILR